MHACMAAPDRLSDLPDDLLIHMLSFAPAREAATTTALSRRWRRPLWLDTGALNLDSRSYTTVAGSLLLRPWLARADANNALASHRSHGRVPDKVTLVMRDQYSMHNGVLRSACGDNVQELRLDCQDPSYVLSPFAALRTLDLTGCNLERHYSSLHVSFPCLEALRLRRCAVELERLQAMIRAAPKLADLRLDSLRFQDRWLVFRLHCPAVTLLVMTNMVTGYIHRCSFELDAPCLRRFRYTQSICYDTSFALNSPPPDLERVHLAMHSSAAPLRSMLHAVCHTKLLKLTVYSIADIDDDGRFGQLPLFPNLEQLEIEELCGCLNNHRAALTAMVNLLCRCPLIRELRIQFSWRKYLGEISDPDEMAQLDFMGCTSFEDGGDCREVLDLPGLHCNCALDCLRNSLRRVVVRFDVDKITCFQVQLVKFLAQNAMVLEELDINGGNHYDSSYIDAKVAGWRATSLPATAAAMVLPEAWFSAACCLPHYHGPACNPSSPKLPPCQP